MKKPIRSIIPFWVFVTAMICLGGLWTLFLVATMIEYSSLVVQTLVVVFLVTLGLIGLYICFRFIQRKLGII